MNDKIPMTCVDPEIMRTKGHGYRSSSSHRSFLIANGDAKCSGGVGDFFSIEVAKAFKVFACRYLFSSLREFIVR